MATQGLLRHPLHARPPSCIVDSRLALLRSCSFSSHFATAFRLSLSSTPASVSAKSMKLQDQGDVVVQARDAYLGPTDADAVDYVNKTTPGPMVEVDPVTVFRCIIAERRANFTMARSKQKADDASLLQSTGTHPFHLGSKWSGKHTIAIALAILLLVLAAIAFFLRSRKDSGKQTELSPTYGMVNNDPPDDVGRHKLVDDSIEAPDSILTAMTIGAASVGRPKAFADPPHDTDVRTNGNLISAQSPNTSVEKLVEDEKTEAPAIQSLGQVPYSPLGSLESQGVKLDVTEGPWFRQDVNDAERLKSTTQNGPIEQDALSNEALANKLVSEMSKGDLSYKTPSASNLVDGEFLGKATMPSSVVAEKPLSSDTILQESFPVGLEDGAILEDSNAILEKLEEVIKQESMPLVDDKRFVGEMDAPGRSQIPEESMPMMEMNTDVPGTYPGVMDFVNDDKHYVTRPLDPLQNEKVVPPGANYGVVDYDNGFGRSVDGGFANAAPFDPTASGLSNGDRPSLAAKPFTYQDSGVLAEASGADSALDPFKEDSREENEKALEAAVPALAVGFGTIGTLLGVAGGLQVVGFAALANFVSQDFFWAQSREEFFQELKGITNRQKLLDFLARRNILRTDEEAAST